LHGKEKGTLGAFRPSFGEDQIEEGGRNFGMSYVNDEWIKYGRKLNNKGKHDNFVVGNFMNKIHVLREEEMTLLILCIAYSFSYEELWNGGKT